MNILVTNEDGIFSPGVNLLVEVLQHFGDVYVICPDKEQKAVSHSITLQNPLQAKPVSIFPGVKGSWAVNGTPADCVKLGMDVLMKEKPDIVFSGLNTGANLGRDFYYSGTMAAAAEASLYGIRSVSMSLDIMQDNDLKEVQIRPLIYEMIRTISQNKIPKGVFLNINFPHLPKEQCQGVAVLPLDMTVSRYRHIGLSDTHGNAFYWLKDDIAQLDEGKDNSDFYKLKQGYITVSPVEFRKAQTRKKEQIENWFQSTTDLIKEVNPLT